MAPVRGRGGPPLERGGPPGRHVLGDHFYVYGLRAPDETVYRYVGVTGEPRGRWHQHVTSGRRLRDSGLLAAVSALLGVKTKDRWVAGLLRARQRPVMDLLERLPCGGAAILGTPQRARAEAREQAWIARLAGEGHPLFNVHGRAHDGAEGTRPPYPV